MSDAGIGVIGKPGKQNGGYYNVNLADRKENFNYIDPHSPFPALAYMNARTQENKEGFNAIA